MCVIECGTIEEPENVLKALMDDNIDEVVRLLQVLGEEAYYWFTLTDVTGYDPRRYFEIYTNPEIKCRFSIVGMTLVFGSETMVRTVLDNVSKKCLTARCRMYVLDQNHQYMDMFAEYEAPFVLTKTSLFHDPKKFHLLELMRKEYGLDLSVVAEVMSYYFERTENLDMKAENPWPFGDDNELMYNLDPPMDHFCRRRSILAAIAHELQLDMLDRYCKLYPHTLLPDGCFHLGRCLKVGDFDRLRVLFNNGLHHRPEYAKRKWLAKRPYDEFSEMNIVVMYTNNGKHELSEHDLVHLLSMHVREMIGCRPIEEGVGCNFHKMNEYFNVVSGPPEQDGDD